MIFWDYIYIYIYIYIGVPFFGKLPYHAGPKLPCVNLVP